MFISNAYAQSGGAAPAGGEFMQIGFLIVLFCPVLFPRDQAAAKAPKRTYGHDFCFEKR